MTIAAEKEALRRLLRRRIAGHPKTAGDDRALAANVLAMGAWKDAGGVLLFASMPEEPDTRPLLIRALEEGRRVAVPRFDPGGGVYRPHWILDPAADLVPGRFGIPEPAVSRPASPGEIDLALLPGLGFDAAGRRIGRGRGYIDEMCRWLVREAPGSGSQRGRSSWQDEGLIRVGLAFSWQIVDRVPTGPRDVGVHWVVTERETIRVAGESPGRDRR